MVDLTRRAALGAVPALSALPTVATASTGLYGPEIARRVDHHIECIKALQMAAHPTIKGWNVIKLGPEVVGNGSIVLMTIR